MKITVSTNITEEESDLLKNKSVFNNYFEGRDSNVSPNFIVEGLEIKKFKVKYADRNTFHRNIAELVAISQKRITFIHIFCYNSTDNPQENPTPIRFKVVLTKDLDNSFSNSSIDASNITLGRMSQFQMANITGLDADINISKLEIPTDATANLIIIVGFKQS